MCGLLLRTLAVVAIATTSATRTPAQAVQFDTSPAGYLERPGELYTLQLGALPTMRFQQGDGGLRQGNPLSVLGVGCRLDNRSYDATMGVGRSWTRVALNMSETANALKMLETFQSNRLATPVSVFDGKVTWPTVTGRPQKPKWGAEVAFPFRSPFAYGGKNDLLLEWVFQGGSLANQGTWRSSLPYYLDAASATGVSFSDEAANITTGQCGNAAVRMTWNNFHQDHATPSYRGKTLAIGETWNAVAGKPLIHAWGLPLQRPVNIGALCNNLHIQPMVFFFGVGSQPSPPFDPGGSHRTSDIWFRSAPSSFGVTAGAQAAFENAQGRLSLTGARTMRLAGAPPAPVAKILIWSDNPATTTGTRLNTPWTMAFLAFAYR